MSGLDAESLLKLVPDAVIATDGDQRIIVWNPAAQRIYGWSADEALGQVVSELLQTEMTEDQRAAALEQLRAEGSWHGRVIQRHRDGQTLHILSAVSVSPARDAPGVATLVAVNRDISVDVRRETERRLAEGALRQMRELADARRGFDERLRGVLEIGCGQLGLPTGIVARIEGDRYEVVSTVDATGALAGGEIFELGKTVCSVTITGDRPVHYDKLSNSELADHPCYTELALQSYIGAPIGGEGGPWGTVNFSGRTPRPLPFSSSDDELVGLLALLVEQELRQATEATRRRDNEATIRALQKTEALALMAGGLAHDFNNVLSGITGAAEVAIARERADEPIGDLLDEIRGSARSGVSMGRRLLSLASPAGKDAPADPDGLVRDARDLFALLLPDRVELEVDLGARGARVDIEAGAFEQVLLNLVVNARDAMPDGGRLAVRTRTRNVESPRQLDQGRLAPGDYLVLEVEDSGAGIDEDTRATMFDLFFTTKPTGTGTGLGLATVRTIVTETGGAIEVDSAVGRGSRFLVYIPVVSTPRAEPAASAEPVALVLDDDPGVRAVARQCLEEAGYRVFEASDAHAALERARLEPELALVVAALVRADGQHELGATLSEICPTARRVWMTAFPLDALAEAGRLPDGDPLIAKPLSRGELLAAADAALETEKPAASAKRTVLLVEDHRLSRLAVTTLLEDAGHQVLVADSGEAALAELARHGQSVDALITDLHLPDVDGARLASLVRQRSGDLQVVFVSGASRDEPVVRAALSQPRSAYLKKPFDIAELERLLAAPR